MRKVGLLVAMAIGLAGCPRDKQIERPVGDDAMNQTRLGCPKGGVELGAMPPMGTDLWCSKRNETGASVRHGPARTWWPDGRPKEIGAYAEDRKTGRWWSYAAEGHLSSEGAYVSGVATGYWTFYRPDGSVAEEGPMHDGGRDGLWVIYDADSRFPMQGLYVDGEKEGVWIDYNADGRAIRERVFRRGREINRREL